METKILTQNELKMILESLEFSKHKFENYEKYPSNEFKQARINEISQLISKIKSLIE